MLSGRIIKALSGFYYVWTDEEIPRLITCRARGIFKHKRNVITPLVGDLVDVDLKDQVNEGTVITVKPRSSELLRPPVANVTQVLVVFSADEPAFQPELLDKFLIFIEYEGLTPVILISKCDLLVDRPELLAALQRAVEVYRSIGYEIYEMAADRLEGLDPIRNRLEGHLSVLAGQSGVGKSSLMNRIMPERNQETGEVSVRLGRGRHTTRLVELMAYGQDGWLADTPGFSQLDLSLIPQEALIQGYREFREFAQRCKFRGCSHLHEPGCTVRAAVDQGDISLQRYESYQQWMNEWNEHKRRGLR